MKATKEWLDFLLKESESYQNLILTKKLNDASTLGGALARLISRGKAERPSGVLLTGPHGSGRHHAAFHILQALDRENCAPVFLTGASLTEGISDFSGLADRLNALLDAFYDRNQGLCIVLEKPEACGFSGQLYPFLGKIAHEYRTHSDELPALFMILIAETPPALPSVLQEQLLCCVCTIPDSEKRRAFLDDRAGSLKTYVDLSELAKQTEGCSYTAIDQVVKNLEFLVDVYDRAPEHDTILTLIHQVAPEIRPEPVDPIAAALEQIETVFSEISGKLSNLRFGEPVISPAKEHKSAIDLFESNESRTDSNDLSVDRHHFEEMTIHSLSVELFGEDRVNALLQN